MKDERNYGVDMLRILSMLMIVILHILGIGGILDTCEPLSFKYATVWFLEAACYCSVNCYALISGYVGISASYKYSNIILLWLRVVFYTLSITVLFGIFMPGTVGKTIVLRSLFPVMKSPYWYFTAYFCLFLFIPVLNQAINSMSKAQMRAVVMAAIFVISVLQTIFGDVFGTSEGSSALWLIVLYMIGAYIRKFDAMKNMTTGKALIGYLIATFLSWGYKLVADAAPQFGGEDSRFGSFIAAYSDRLIRFISPTILASAVFLLIAFKKIKLFPGAKKFIAFVSPMSFSVYLIHAHPLIWRNFMKSRFEAFSLLSTPVLVIAVLGTALAIFGGCCACDMVRISLFKKIRLKQKLEDLEKKYIGELW